MRAARIFAFARTMRWASVAGGARKARAISSVVRPEISRSVSATCASAESDGWQHVKIRRSGSSAISSPSSHRAALSGIASTAMATSPSMASKRARRRMPSIALKRPAETSHGTGLAGTPSRGHCSTAALNASCIASSARSKSPSRRISVASTLRESRRNRVATVAAMSAGAAWASTDTAASLATSGAPAQDADQHDRADDEGERRPHRVGEAEQFDGGIGTARAGLEDVGQQAIELARAHDAVGEGEVARRGLRRYEVLPRRRRHAGDGEQQREGAGDAAAGRAAPHETEHGEDADRDEDEALQHAPGAGLHRERVLRDERGDDDAERERGDEREPASVRRSAAAGEPRPRRRHSATWAISSISTQAASGSWATP